MLVCVLVLALLCVTPKVISHEVTEVCLPLTSEDGAGPSVVHQDMTQIEETDLPCIHQEAAPRSGAAMKVKPAQKNIHISTAMKKEDGRRMWNKQHSCYYCGKDVAKMARHLEDMHPHEVKVAEALGYEKRSKNRRLIFELLTRRGDYVQNLEVLHLREGSLRILRKPTEDQASSRCYTDYGPCPGCYAFLVKSELWRHCKTCEHYQKVIGQEGGEHGRMQRDSRLLLIGDVIGMQIDQKFLSEILSTMQDDHVSRIVRDDWLITRLGYSIYEQHGSSQKKVISQAMRTMARFLLCAREVMDSDVVLEDMIEPEKFDAVVSVVHALAQRSETERNYPKFETPSLALRVGNHLMTCAGILLGKALRNRDDDQEKKVTNFVSLYKIEWKRKVSSHARSSLA